MLDILAYIVIPIYTILFAWDTDWFTTNFSVIGNMSHKNNDFLLWGLLIGLYFYLSLRRILKCVPRNKKETILVTSAGILLLFAVTTPYLPGQFPFRSFLHVIFAFCASVLLLASLYFIVWKLYLRQKEVYRPYLTALFCSTAICAVLLVIAGIVSSALEIYFTIFCSVLVRKLDKRLLRGQVSGPF